MHHASVVDMNLTRDKFTRHGLHMNSSGKARIAKTIGQNITILSASGNPPISLKLEEVTLATPTVETKMGFISKNDDGVHKNAAIIIIIIICLVFQRYTRVDICHHADRRDLR